MAYIKLQALCLPIKGTSDYGDFQQSGHSNNWVLSSTLNAFIYIMAIHTKHFENIFFKNHITINLYYVYYNCNFQKR